MRVSALGVFLVQQIGHSTCGFDIHLRRFVQALLEPLFLTWLVPLFFDQYYYSYYPGLHTSDVSCLLC